MRELPIHTAMKRRTAFGVAFAFACLPWIVVIGMAGLRALSAGRPMHEVLADVAGDLVTLTLSHALACVLVLTVAMVREAPASARDALSIRRSPAVVMLVATLGGLAMHIVLAEIANVVEIFAPIALETKLELARRLTPTDLVSGTALVLEVLFVAPVGEELVFRGLLLPRLALYTGSREAHFLTAVLFALCHATAGPHAMLAALIGGLVLGFVSRARRSVLPAIALHAGSNAVPLLLPSSLVRVPGLNVLRDGPSHISPVLVVTAALVTGAAILFLARDDHDDPA